MHRLTPTRSSNPAPVNRLCHTVNPVRFSGQGLNCNDLEAVTAYVHDRISADQSCLPHLIDTIASLTNSPEVLKFLIPYAGGVDQPVYRFQQATFLHRAAAQGKLALVKQLLTLGADPLVQDKDGKTPLDWLAESSQGSGQDRQVIRQMMTERAIELGVDYRRQLAERSSWLGGIKNWLGWENPVPAQPNIPVQSAEDSVAAAEPASAVQQNLVRQLEAQTADLKSEAEKKAALQQQLDAAQKEIQALRQKMGGFEHERDHAAYQTRQREAMWSADKQSLQSQIQLLKQQQAEAYQSGLSEKKRLQQEISSLKASLAAEKRAAQEAAARGSGLEESIQQERENYQTRLSELTRQMTELKKEKEEAGQSHGQALETLKKQSHEQQLTLKRTQKRNEALTKERQAHPKTVQQQTETLDQLNQNNERLRQENADLLKAKEQRHLRGLLEQGMLKGDIQTLQAEKEALSQALETSNQELETMKRQRLWHQAKWLNRNNQLLAEVGSSNSREEALKNQLREAEDQASQLAEQRDHALITQRAFTDFINYQGWQNHHLHQNAQHHETQALQAENKFSESEQRNNRFKTLLPALMTHSSQRHADAAREKALYQVLLQECQDGVDKAETLKDAQEHVGLVQRFLRQQLGSLPVESQSNLLSLNLG